VDYSLCYTSSRQSVREWLPAPVAGLLLSGMTNGKSAARRGMKPFWKQVRYDSQSQVKMGTGTLHCSLKRMLADRHIEAADERPDSAPDDERQRSYRLMESEESERQSGHVAPEAPHRPRWLRK
jgi:hypothetical protein